MDVIITFKLVECPSSINLSLYSLICSVVKTEISSKIRAISFKRSKVFSS